MSQNIMFLDTETTGMISKKLPPDMPGQPRVIQVGVIITDDEGKQLEEYQTLVKIGQTPIHPMALAVHKITHEMANSQGAEPRDVAFKLTQMVKTCKMVVCHNVEFDMFVMEILYATENLPFPFDDVYQYCTMLMATGPCQLRNAKGGAKWPKLEEACRILLGREPENLHTATGDCILTKEIFFKLRELKKAAAPPSSPQTTPLAAPTDERPSAPVASEGASPV